MNELIWRISTRWWWITVQSQYSEAVVTLNLFWQFALCLHLRGALWYQMQCPCGSGPQAASKASSDSAHLWNRWLLRAGQDVRVSAKCPGLPRETNMQIRTPKQPFRPNAGQTNDKEKNSKSMDMGLPSRLSNMLQDRRNIPRLHHLESLILQVWAPCPHLSLIYSRPRQGVSVIEIAFSVWADLCQRRQKLIFPRMLYLPRLVSLVALPRHLHNTHFLYVPKIM